MAKNAGDWSCPQCIPNSFSPVKNTRFLCCSPVQFTGSVVMEGKFHSTKRPKAIPEQELLSCEKHFRALKGLFHSFYSCIRCKQTIFPHHWTDLPNYGSVSSKTKLILYNKCRNTEFPLNSCRMTDKASAAEHISAKLTQAVIPSQIQPFWRILLHPHLNALP